nr:MAG TPA: hypothetical protein [Caudoviricetes sp.]
MHQLCPCVYTAIDLNLSTYPQNFAHGFVYVLTELYASIHSHL